VVGTHRHEEISTTSEARHRTELWRKGDAAHIILLPKKVGFEPRLLVSSTIFPLFLRVADLTIRSVTDESELADSAVLSCPGRCLR